MPPKKVHLKLDNKNAQKSFSLLSIKAPDKICSVLEVVSQHQHQSVISNSSQHLAVLEQHPYTSNQATSLSDQTDNGEYGSISSEHVGYTQIWLLDLCGGSVSHLGRIKGCCSHAVFHPSAPILAVVQPPSALHIFQVAELTCSEVVEYSNLIGPLRGVQWLPDDVDGMFNAPSALPRDHRDRQSLQLPLLTFTESEVVMLRPPQASKRLKMTQQIVWAGAVCGGFVAAVRNTGAVELWHLSGTETAAIIPLPEEEDATATGLITCATPVDNEWILLGGRLPCLVLCDVSSRHSQKVLLPPAIPSHLVALCIAPDGLRPNGKVLLVLDNLGAVHVLSIPAFELIRTLKSPKLRIKSISVSPSGDLVSLTYSNKTTKLYPVSCLRPQSDMAATEALPKRHLVNCNTAPQRSTKNGCAEHNNDGITAGLNIPSTSELTELRDDLPGGILKNNFRDKNRRTEFKENSVEERLKDINHSNDLYTTGGQHFRSDRIFNAESKAVLSNSNKLNVNRTSSSSVLQSMSKNLRVGKSTEKLFCCGDDLSHDTEGPSHGVNRGEPSSNRPKVVLRSRTFNTTDGSKRGHVSNTARECSLRSGGEDQPTEETMRARVRFDIDGVSAEEEEIDEQQEEETCHDGNSRRRRDKENRKLTAAAKKVKQTVNHTDWRSLLAEFGRFPAGQRGAVWCSLLQLPRGATIHAALCKKHTHARVLPYDNMTDQALKTAFRSTLSCLFHWAPSLANVPWLPSFVFPFAKSLQSSPLLCFEVAVTLIGSWCRSWFTSPSSRSPAVSAVDALLCDASPRLMARLVAADVDTDTYAWPLMTSAFAQVLSPEDWLTAWDHLLSQPPSFLLCFTAAFTLCLQPTIAVAETSAQIKLLYGQESFLPVRAVLRRAYDVQRSMKLEDDLLQKLDRIAPFPKGGLPVFDAIVHTSEQQSSNIALDELNTLMDDVAIKSARRDLLCREQRCFDNIRAIRRRHVQQYRDGARDVVVPRAPLL